MPMPLRGSIPAVVALLLSLLPLPTFGHDMWIEPVPGPIEPGDLVRMDVRMGHGGAVEPVLRNEGRLLRAEGHGPSRTLDLPGLHGAQPMGVLRPDEPGTWILAYEGNAAPHRLTPGRFEDYLAEEGLEHIAELRRRAGTTETPGTELYSRSLKGLVTVGADAHDGRRPEDRRIGLPLELVLERIEGDGHLTLRLYADAPPRGPLAGSKVDFRRPDGPEPEAWGRTDDDGRIRVRLDPGPWVAATVWMREEPSEAADWRTVFTTLTFVLPAKVR